MSPKGEPGPEPKGGGSMIDCKHRKPPMLSYGAWHSDAAERHRRGERQVRCPVCGKWIWEEYFPPRPARSQEEER